MKIGDKVFVHGYVDEIRKDIIIIRNEGGYFGTVPDEILPSAQPGIIRCKDCKYGEQDEVGRWFCRSLGCQIGNEDGSGFCADAERRE